MPRFFQIKRALLGRLTSRAFRFLKLGVVSAVSLVMLSASPKNAFAQFPGVGSEAPSGMATQADYGGVSSNANDAVDNVSDGSESNSAIAVSGQSDDDGNQVDYQSTDSGFSTSVLKKEKSRKHLFIKKLRLEFAAIEFVERRTGLPFSRDDVPRYLDELRSDLRTIAGKEERGTIVAQEVQSVARDVYHIETQLNEYLDRLLNHLSQPVPKEPFFKMAPASPETSRATNQKLDLLALKFELTEYGEKALQALRVRGY